MKFEWDNNKNEIKESIKYPLKKQGKFSLILFIFHFLILTTLMMKTGGLLWECQKELL